MLAAMFVQGLRTILLFFLLLVPAGLCHAWNGKVVSVADGDTITVFNGREEEKIRLQGVDTPEKGQAFGTKAKQFTAGKVQGAIVKVNPVTRDRYGRTVAMVFVAGQSLNEALIREGYAWVYRKYCQESYCEEWLRLEQQARERKKGLWADPHAVPPWEWRQQEREGQGGSTSPDAAGLLHGNVKSGVFHQPGCKAYNCRNCTRVFQSRAEAVAAGFRPCGMCKP